MSSRSKSPSRARKSAENQVTSVPYLLTQSEPPKKHFLGCQRQTREGIVLGILLSLMMAMIYQIYQIQNNTWPGVATGAVN